MKTIIRVFGKFLLGTLFFALMFLIIDSLLVPRIFGDVRPEAYKKSYYWGESFVKESSKVADLRSIKRTSVGDVLTSSNFDGQYIDVVRGLRRTEPVPISPKYRIVTFGGSTTFCVEVPDALTWPSQLAQKVFDREIEVMNGGLSGATFADRVKAFEGLDLTNAGDVAVFFVGINDAVIGNQNNQVVGPLARWPRLRRAVEISLGLSNSGRLVLDRSQQLSFEITASTSEAVARFRQSLVSAEEFAASSHVRLLVVLQPSRLISGSPIWGNPTESVGESFSKSFRDFYRQIINGSDFQGRVVDGTRIFDSLNESPYLDFAHVQESGNQAIASFIFSELKKREWLN